MDRKIYKSCLLAIFGILISSKTVNALDSSDLPVKSPKFDQNLEPAYRLMTGGGSMNPLPSAQAKLLQPIMPMSENTSLQIIKETKQGLQYLFQTKSPFVAAIIGTGSTAIEASLDNMIEPGDTVFIPITGFWSRHAVGLSKRLGAIVKFIKKEPGQVFSVQEIKNSIMFFRPKVVFIVIGESYTGVKQNIKGIGELCIQLNCYVVTDAVAFTPMQPLYFDAWKIDVALCNSQKGIGSVIGLAPMVYSRRAVEMVKRRKTRPTSYDHDVSKWVEENYWFMNEDPDKNQKPSFAFPTVQLYALREALRSISEEGIENVWARHKTVHTYFADKIASEVPQLHFFVRNETNRLIGTSILTVPNETRLDEILLELLNRYSVHVATGEGTASLEKKMRVSLFGPNAQIDVADKVISALKAVFNH